MDFLPKLFRSIKHPLFLGLLLTGICCITVIALFDKVSPYALALLFVPTLFLMASYSKLETQGELEPRRYEERYRRQEEMQLAKHQQVETMTRDFYSSLLKDVTVAVCAREPHSHLHVLNVQRYALAIAQELLVSREEQEAIELGALLHDIGKLGIPDYTLLKPGRLNAEEYARVKKHPELGAALLGSLSSTSPIMAAVRYHHERWDGSGYPDGLAGKRIPLVARILAVADVYDALTSKRNYHEAWSHENAVNHIQNLSGKHFDPEVVSAFVRAIGNTPDFRSLKVQNLSDAPARLVQRASIEGWALLEVAQALSSYLGLQEMLSLLAGKLEAIFPHTCCVFMLKEEGADRLCVHAASGINASFFESGKTRSNDSVSLNVYRTQRSYLGEYSADDLYLPVRAHAIYATQWNELHSAMIVPIIYQDEVLGAVNLYHTQLQAFNAADLSLLEAIAKRTSIALYNSLLFDRARDHALLDPLTGLYNVRYLNHYIAEQCEKGTAARPMKAATKAPFTKKAQKTAQTSGPSWERRSTKHSYASKTLTRRLMHLGQPVDSSAVPADELEMLQNESQTPLPETAFAEDPTASYQFALLCLDLDNFKPVNDKFGHSKGDEVLRSVASIFRSAVRLGDAVARCGGDEFAIVLPGAESAIANEISNRIQQAVSEFEMGLLDENHVPLRLGVSIGISYFPQDGKDCDALLAAADSRMYYRKTENKQWQAGRKNVPVYRNEATIPESLPHTGEAEAA